MVDKKKGEKIEEDSPMLVTDEAFNIGNRFGELIIQMYEVEKKKHIDVFAGITMAQRQYKMNMAANFGAKMMMRTEQLERDIQNQAMQLFSDKLVEQSDKLLASAPADVRKQMEPILGMLKDAKKAIFEENKNAQEDTT